MIVPAVIAPDTLSAVRAMSISGSIEISSAAIVTGRPIAGSTISAANVAPPPTPAIPKELTVMIAIRDRIVNSVTTTFLKNIEKKTCTLNS